MSESRQVRLGKLFGDIGPALAGNAPLDETLQRCAESIVTHLDSPWVRIWVRDENRDTIVLRASAGVCAVKDTIGLRLTPQAGIAANVVREGTMYITDDLASDATVANFQPALEVGCSAFGGFPLRVSGEVQGVLAVFGRHPFENDVIDTLTTIANSMAVTLPLLKA